MTGKNKWARHKSRGWAKEQARERCPQIDYTGQVMQVLLLLLINSVSCYVNVLHGMSGHWAKVQGSRDYSLNKDVAQTAWNGVCVSVPVRVMMDDNRMRRKSLLLCFCNTDTSLPRLEELGAGFVLPTSSLQKSWDGCIFLNNNYGCWFWLLFISWTDSI